MKNKEYSIPFAGLKQGKHKFEYHIDNTFFESFDYFLKHLRQSEATLKHIYHFLQ